MISPIVSSPYTRTCLVIIDNCQREFLGTHLFCSELKRHNINCVLVPWNLPINVYYAIAKSLKPEFAILTFLRKGASSQHINVLKSLGIKILVHENEGYPYERQYREWEEHEGWDLFLPLVHRVYLWGDRQKSTLAKRFPDLVSKLFVAGSIRLSALRTCMPLIDLPVTKKRLFLVLSSSIPYPKYLTRVDEFLLHTNTGISICDLLNSFVHECVDIERVMSVAFAAKNYIFNHLDIAIRPHPYASPDDIRHISSQYGLETCLLGSDVPLWSQLQCSDILIHAGSTCALEAEALGIPSIQLKMDNTFELDFVNRNIGCHTLPAVLEQISIALSNTQPDTSLPNTDDKLYWPPDQSTIDIIVNDICSMSVSHQSLTLSDIIRRLLDSGVKLSTSLRDTPFQIKYRNKLVQFSDLELVLNFAGNMSSCIPLIFHEHDTSAPICLYT